MLNPEHSVHSKLYTFVYMCNISQRQTRITKANEGRNINKPIRKLPPSFTGQCKEKRERWLENIISSQKRYTGKEAEEGRERRLWNRIK